ncbi:MAG: AAA family ATPase [Actinomycetota bacterium]
MNHLDYLSQLVTEMVDHFEGVVAEGESFTFTYGDSSFTGRVYERFNGHLVVAFEVEVCTTSLTRRKQELLNRLNGLLPFTSFKVVKAANSKHTITATHALSVSTIAAEQLVEALDSIAFQANEHRHELSHGDSAQRVEKSLREETKQSIEPTRFEGPFSDNIDDDVDDGGNESDSAQRARRAKVRSSSAGTADILADLRRLVGLEPVKIEVERLVAAREFTNARVALGLPAIEQSPHLVFTGNPGTGKTTVARLVADLYKALGILKKGHVVEADCSKLIAAYIGQTPIKTQRLCEQARGGVLFIDEAYGLTSHQHQGYGPEAIETLLKFMEDNRGEIVVIVAGYPQEMQGFLDANPGLRSRFDVVIDFPDYSTDELTKIFDLYLDQFELSLTPQARQKVVEYTDSMPRRRGFGNGREMRNLFNEVVRRHAVWAGRNGHIDPTDLRIIDAEVIPSPLPLCVAGTSEVRPRGYL